MMRRFFIQIFLSGIIFLTIPVYYHFQKNNISFEAEADFNCPSFGEVGEGFPMGIGTDDDPKARLEYERSRLIDPQTNQIPPNIRAKEMAFAQDLPKYNRHSRTQDWQPRGPYNVGGRTRALALDVNNENIILAGGVTGGMWRSANGGASFVKTTTPDQMHSVTCVTQDTRPGKTDTWYYGTGEYYAVIAPSAEASGNGIFKSTNGGQSWQLLSSTASNTPTTFYQNGDFDFVWNMTTDPTDLVNDVVYAAVINGIFKSMDGGQSWNAVLGFDSTGLSYFTNITMTSSGIFYAAISSGTSSSGLWRSTDGDNWTEITPLGWPNSFRRVVMGIAPSDENKVYFLAETRGSGKNDHSLWHYTYISGDGSGAGGLWDNRTIHLPQYDCEVFYDFTFGTYKSQSSYDMAIAVKPDDENVVFIGGIDVHRSTDGFQSDTAHAWIGGYQCDTVTPSNYIYPDHHPDQHYFIFLPSNPDVMFTASDGGVHKTLNCMASEVIWQSLNNGYVTSQFYTVAMEEGMASGDILVGGMQDNGTFFTNNMDPSVPWEHAFYGDGGYCAIAEGRNNYYLSWQTGKIFKFEIDDNGNVLGKTRIDPLGGSGYSFINPFILNPANNNIMYLAGGKFIWRQNDLSAIPVIGNEYNTISQGWQRFNSSNIGLSGPGQFAGISALAMSKADDRTIYYGSSDGKLFRLDSLHTANPVKVNIKTNDLPNGAYVSSLAVNPNDVNEVLVTFSNYHVKSIFYSVNGGSSWTDISGNLEENSNGSGDGPAVLWAEFLNLKDSTIYYAGTSIGLFSTNKLDSTATIWTQEGAGTIGNVVINMIKTRQNDGLVVTATHGNGIYSKRFQEVTATETVSKKVLQVSQNFPNPFSQQTIISYSLPGPVSTVYVTIYAMNGREIKQLAGDKKSAGNHTVSWDGTNKSGKKVPPGNYIYELRADDQTVSKKLILLR